MTTTTNETIDTTDHGNEQHPAKIVNGRTKNLTIPLTEREKSQKGEVVAHLVQKIGEKKEARKNAGAQLKAEIDQLEAELKTVSLEISTGVVYREVPIREVHNYRLGVYQEIRLDTEKVIFERPLTAEERQPALPGLGGGADDEDDDDEPGPRNWTPDETEDGIVDDDYVPDGVTQPEPELETEKPKKRGGRRKVASSSAEAE